MKQIIIKGKNPIKKKLDETSEKYNDYEILIQGLQHHDNNSNIIKNDLDSVI